MKKHLFKKTLLNLGKDSIDRVVFETLTRPQSSQFDESSIQVSEAKTGFFPLSN